MRVFAISAVFQLFALTAFAQPSGAPLAAELTRIGTDTAAIIPSSAIDDYPIWSPDSATIAVNIMGDWTWVNLESIQLAEADWHQQLIGVLDAEPDFGPLSPELQDSYRAVTVNGPREVTTSQGVVIELKQSGLGVSFSITHSRQEPEPRWTSDLENCHSLSLSPDEAFVAYICETNGLIITRLAH